ncbi:MAG: hypothetical protein DHS20C21_16350 [Gemmatimonadota bacterium]|nr:MAG: hypothetical protein DHS20C21_16350 [Gemmatimonadota bacterium]
MSSWLAWDERMFILLNQKWTSPFLDVVMPFLTDFDHWRIPVIVVLLLALAKGKTEARIAILFAILAVALADQISSSGIKPLFERLRPFHVVEDTRKLVGAHNYSFPSSHAANTFAAATFLALRFARLRWLLILATLVAYSRVYVGVHYPFDVIGGAALGAAIGATFAAVERTSRIRMEKWLSFGKKKKRVTDAAADDGSEASGTPNADPDSDTEDTKDTKDAENAAKRAAAKSKAGGAKRDSSDPKPKD